MRVKSSIINVAAGLGSQVIITLLSFISRSIFVTILGVEYLGVNGLFSNVLGVLGLAEAGIGASIIYALYKPVAENDQEKIKLLMRLYRNAYRAIALVVFLLGVSLMPFLSHIVGESKVENIELIYFIFLLSSVSQYLFTYKISMFNVSQKGYIATSFYSVSSILSTLIKIAVLYETHNFILYILVEFALTIVTSILLSVSANRRYPFLKAKVTGKLDSSTKEAIVKNIKAIVLHQIGAYAVFGTDNIIISSFVSVAAVGLYSNYYMLINICRTFVNQIFDNITHSIGNLIAEQEQSKIYNVFKVTMFCNFWIYSSLSTVLYISLDPFISLWLGKDFVLGKSVLIVLMINFYVTGLRRSINIVKQTSGIFHEDRYAPFIEAAINLVLSVILVRYMGIAGVFLGTLISTLAVPFWVAPFLVYKKVFNKSLLSYFLAYTGYAGVAFGCLILSDFICNQIEQSDAVGLIMKVSVALIVPTIIKVGLFYKSEQFKYLWGVGIPLARKVMLRKKSVSGM